MKEKLIKKYELFRVSAIWNQKDYKRNGTSFIYAKQNDSDRVDIYDWWKRHIRKKKMQAKKPIELIELKISFLGRYSWVMTWFSHKTFTVFETEEEAFSDFSRYLNEEWGVIENFHHSYEIYDDPKLFYEDKTPACLMGAEDRWRWKFCGCDKCKELGITIINH